MIVFRCLLCVGPWGFAGVAFEDIIEIGLGGETAFVADLRQGHIGGNEKMHGLFQPLLLNVFMGCFAGGGLKEIVKIKGFF